MSYLTVEVLVKCYQQYTCGNNKSFLFPLGCIPLNSKWQKLFLSLKLKITLTQTIGLFLCCLTLRIFEKLVFSRIESFIEQNDILSPSQYGFRKAHSTQHAILDIVSTIQENMGKHLFSCGVFIDWKKAFDTVEHKILLHKLDRYGFRGFISGSHLT